MVMGADGAPASSLPAGIAESATWADANTIGASLGMFLDVTSIKGNAVVCCTSPSPCLTGKTFPSEDNAACGQIAQSSKDKGASLNEVACMMIPPV